MIIRLGLMGVLKRKMFPRFNNPNKPSQVHSQVGTFTGIPKLSGDKIMAEQIFRIDGKINEELIS